MKRALVLSLALSAVTLSAFSPALTPSAQACGSYAPSFTGVVKSVNLKQRTVTIRYETPHDPHSITITSFSAFSHEQLEGLRANDQVVFEFFPSGSGRHTLSSIYVVAPEASEQG